MRYLYYNQQDFWRKNRQCKVARGNRDSIYIKLYINESHEIVPATKTSQQFSIVCSVDGSDTCVSLGYTKKPYLCEISASSLRGYYGQNIEDIVDNLNKDRDKTIGQLFKNGAVFAPERMYLCPKSRKMIIDFS